MVVSLEKVLGGQAHQNFAALVEVLHRQQIQERGVVLVVQINGLSNKG